MNYIIEINDAKELLAQGKYSLCTIQCGRILEYALRSLYKDYSLKADPESLNMIRVLLARKGKSVGRLTLGDLCLIYEKTGAFDILARENGINTHDLDMLNLMGLVRIRNKAQHESIGDKGRTIAAEAHMIFGCLLKFLDSFSLVEESTTVSEPANTDAKPKESVVTPKKPAVGKYDNKRLIDVCKNKISGKHFIYIKQAEHDQLLLVTPDGVIKALNQDLFSNVEENDEKELLEKGLISEKQIQKYRRDKTTSTNKGSKKITNASRKTYSYNVKGASAKLKIVDGRFFILKGSTAVISTQSSCPKNALIKREKLIETGKLVKSGTYGVYEFTEDIEFTSSSAAAAVISGSSSNGLLCFGLKK